MVVSTNLKSDAGKTEDSLRDRMKVERINVLVFPTREDRPLRIQPRIFNSLARALLCGPVHQRGIFL